MGRKDQEEGRLHSLHMCTHTHIPACIHKYTHTYTCMHTHTHTHTYTHTHTHIRTHKYTMHARMYAHNRTHRHVHNARSHVRARAHTHTQTHTRTRTHAHVRMHAYVRVHTRVHTHVGGAHRARRPSHRLAVVFKCVAPLALLALGLLNWVFQTSDWFTVPYSMQYPDLECILLVLGRCAVVFALFRYLQHLSLHSAFV